MLNGLYFPGVRPEGAWTDALRPILEKLAVYTIAGEGLVPAAAPVSWDFKVVAPLGDEAKRFHSLVREMTGRDAAVIRAQLLAMSPGPGRDRDEASAGSLTSALHRMDGGAGGYLAKARAERIWQARLFLKLAETVASAEREICLALAALEGRRVEMLKALQGRDNEDAPDEALPLVALPGAPPARLFRVRDQLAAWAVFYLLDSEPETLLISDDPEAAALLVDEVERLAAGRVLSLPDLDLGLVEKEGAAVRKALQDILAGQIEEGLVGLQAFEAKPQLPGSGGRPLVLKLQLLPGVELRQVMADLSGLPGEDGATTLAKPFVLVGATAPGEAYL